jgi:hypothetical protein
MCRIWIDPGAAHADCPSRALSETLFDSARCGTKEAEMF